MAIDRIFPNPTVKEVIFQITYPNLFYLENKIGDIQQAIMKDFPKAELLQRKKIFIANVGPELKIDPKDAEDAPSNKIWRFESKNETVLNITMNSLDISSKSHKTYKLGDDDSKKFRCVIERVVGTFKDKVNLPIINRIGLRYTDKCPLPVKNNEKLREYYNTKFPIEKFEIAEAEAMEFRTILRRGEYYLGYIEKIRSDKEGLKLIIDFDGFATDINASDYLQTTDQLHDLISAEYEATIKQPVYDYMDGLEMR